MPGWSPPSSAYSTEPCWQTDTPEHFYSVFCKHSISLLTCVWGISQIKCDSHHVSTDSHQRQREHVMFFLQENLSLVKRNWWETHVQASVRSRRDQRSVRHLWDSQLPVMGLDVLWLSADVNGWKGRKAQPKCFCSCVETLTRFSFWLCRTCLWGIAAGGVSAR